jgi:hypothetical protein
LLEHLLERESSLTLAMKLIYNMLDTDEVIENEVFYFNPNSDDEEMPSFWSKKSNLQVAWYSDNPDRGASSNMESSAELAMSILNDVFFHGREKM